jgi:hypothetical protein
MSVWPPRGIGTIPWQGPVGNIPTFSWLYMPFILDVVGADLDTLIRPAPDGIPRERNWIRYGEALRVALDQADITLASILAEVGPLLHQRQQKILRLCPPTAAFATREAWRLVGEVQSSLQDVHALVGPVRGESVPCVVCQEDIAVGHPAVLPACHPSHALDEMCVRPMVIEYGSDARCPHCRNAIISPPSSIPPPPPPPSRLPARVPQGSTVVQGAGSACLPIILDETDAGRRAPPPNGRAQCALCRESFGSTRHLIPHVRLAHPNARRVDLQHTWLEACSPPGGCGIIMSALALPQHLQMPRPCAPPRAPPVGGRSCCPTRCAARW